MDQFTFMVDTLTNYKKSCFDYFGDYEMSNDEATNGSLALVESTLLHGYTIAEVSDYKTTLKRVTERV